MRLALIFTVALLAAAANAQPPEPNRPNVRKETPEDEVRMDVTTFAQGLNSDNPYFFSANYVAGAKIGYYGGPEWGQAWIKQRGQSRVNVEKTEVLSLEGNEASVRVTYRWRTSLFQSEPLAETLNLHRGPARFKLRPAWQIVVTPAADAREPGLTTPILSYVAGQILNPQPDSSNTLAAQAILNLKHLTLGVAQFVMDYDDVFAFYPQYAEEALLPYLKDAKPWNVPEQNSKFSFNGNLSTHKLAELKEPSRTVVFYEGEEGKPVFRYDGKAVIAFADRHVGLITPDDLKDLIWKP